MIEAWLDSRKEAPATRQTGINRLSSLLSFCERRGYLKENPINRVERMRVPHVRPEILTIKDCQALVSTASKIDKGMLTYLGLALFCGIRPDEALRIERKEIDLERGLVFLDAEKSKVRNRRIIELTEPARRCIEEGGAVPKLNFQKRFRKLRKDAEIKKWPHDALRKTAASHFYNIYGIEKATEQLGHSAGVLLRVYRQLVGKEDTERWLGISV
jgi:integrase